MLDAKEILAWAAVVIFILLVLFFLRQYGVF